MKILKTVAAVLLGLVVLAAVLYPFRRDPIAMLAGRELSGTEVAYPADWAFTEAHGTIAVEVRPDAPHSVTTICFVHEGVLHVPAMNAGEKEWPSIVLGDPRVRLKIGDSIYPVRAIRLEVADPAPYLASAGKKYAQMAERADDPPPDVWLFRIEPRTEPEG